MIISVEEENSFQIIVDALRNGRVVILPTDTCYGMCTLGTHKNTSSIRRIFDVKKRDITKPISLFIDKRNLSDYVKKSEILTKIVNNFWPGPLTIILDVKEQKKNTLSTLLNYNQPERISFREPDHPLLQKIIKELQIPITGTSANISGEEPIYVFDHLVNSLKLSINDVYVNAGILKNRIPSTVIDLTDELKVKVVREGKISIKEILKVMN